ncbi:MAG: homocysteine S-methyltransferase family protein [Candidatus Aegiribacteria sp.]|nr:homocysteine S-methyltransferase family protein [Candidatus Aegiribacteria sp.]
MDLLKDGKILLADGAIGEYLFSLGYPGNYLACEVVIRSPEILASIHREYSASGAEILTANTFDANIIKLDRRGLADRCEEINCRAVKLAARSRPSAVMGSIGPPGAGRSFCAEPRDTDVLQEAYGPQIQGLLNGGVDLILLETQIDPVQARLIYDIVRSYSSDIPVAVSFTYGHDLLTPSGYSIKDSISEFENTDIVMLGSNHGIGPLQFLDIHRRFASSSPFPVMLQPNAGTGKYLDGRFVFPENPDHFCRCMLSCAGRRTALLGGCCGTTPVFISNLSRKLSEGAEIKVFSSWSADEAEEINNSEMSCDPPSLSVQLAGGNALILELLPPRGGDLSLFSSRAEKLGRFAPVTISIPDSPMGKVRMSPCISGLYLREKLGIEPLVHFALRDRSLTRIHSDLLALSGSGLQGIFLISGDPPSLGDYPESTAVYDLTTEQTLKLLQHLASGKDLNGRKIGRGAGFFPGSAVSLGEQDSVEKVRRRWDAGCRFFITQPVFSMEALERSAELLDEYPVLPALMPFRNKYSAEYLASEVPGISIPDHILAKVHELDDSDVLSFSLDYLSRLMDNMRKMVSGVYIAGSRKGMMRLAEEWRD